MAGQCQPAPDEENPVSLEGAGGGVRRSKPGGAGREERDLGEPEAVLRVRLRPGAALGEFPLRRGKHNPSKKAIFGTNQGKHCEMHHVSATGSAAQLTTWHGSRKR